MPALARSIFARRGAARGLGVARGLALFLLLMQPAGCVEIEGAAAELSWSLRNFAGDRALQCEDLGISTVLLAWREIAEGEPDIMLIPEGTASFPCSDARGVTDFVIPPGRQMLWVIPRCSGDVDPIGPYEVPPPVVRNVGVGAVLTLDSLLIVADRGALCPSARAAAP